MEDFIGRGDRRLAPVIEAAWREGAGMDAWFESLDRAYLAWNKAISQAGLEGNYRKFELNNSSSLQALKVDDLIHFCSQVLTWDHIDTGIEKEWLAQDLQKAVNQEVVPDYSFNSCSECGVCGSELGHNKIEKPPKIPTQETQQSPPSERVCRIRFRFSKRRPMELLSHLDILRLLERALRRSKLPVSYSAGFHPLPRLRIALALPLGIEALGEWMDIDFFKKVDAEYVQRALQEKLPGGINLISTKVIPISKSSINQELHSSTWSFNLNAISGSARGCT